MVERMAKLDALLIELGQSANKPPELDDIEFLGEKKADAESKHKQFETDLNFNLETVKKNVDEFKDTHGCLAQGIPKEIDTVEKLEARKAQAHAAYQGFWTKTGCSGDFWGVLRDWKKFMEDLTKQKERLDKARSSAGAKKRKQAESEIVNDVDDVPLAKCLKPAVTRSDVSTQGFIENDLSKFPGKAILIKDKSDSIKALARSSQWTLMAKWQAREMEKNKDLEYTRVHNQ